MRPGDRVTYVAPDGTVYRGTVTAVVGTGPSHYKRLDLRYESASGREAGVQENVPHVNDRELGIGYWTLDAVVPPPPPPSPAPSPISPPRRLWRPKEPEVGPAE